jgi:hypothetical protein
VRPARASARTDRPTEVLETFLKAHRVLFLTYATLTEAGTEACGRAWPVLHEAARTHLSRHLSDKDLRCLHTALSKVLEGSRSPDEVRGAPAAAPAGS